MPPILVEMSPGFRLQSTHISIQEQVPEESGAHLPYVPSLLNDYSMQGNTHLLDTHFVDTSTPQACHDVGVHLEKIEAHVTMSVPLTGLA